MASARSLSSRVLEEAAGEPGERREAHRRQDAVAVHVAHALVDVVGARPHLGEVDGVEAPLLLRPADHRVQAHRAGHLVLEQPLLDRRRRPSRSCGAWSLVLGRHVAVEHVGRLDDVVVDAHQDHVFGVHGFPPVAAAPRSRCLPGLNQPLAHGTTASTPTIVACRARISPWGTSISPSSRRWWPSPTSSTSAGPPNVSASRSRPSAVASVVSRTSSAWSCSPAPAAGSR